MELGRYLVRELDFEDGVDTLGRWMAHHLAQLMDAVDHAATEEERVRAQQAAIETILKIWEHRAVLPGKTYPLRSLEEVLPVLKQLQPSNNPFHYFRSLAAAKKEQLAAGIFDNLTRLIIALLLPRLPPAKEDESEEYIMSSLDETELYVLQTVNSWWGFIIPEEDTMEEEQEITDESQSDKSKDEPDKFDLNQVALQLINNIGTKLEVLKATLEGKTDNEEDGDDELYEDDLYEGEPDEV